ncbi:hypothetical protein EG850_05905 [Gulosibacter macacae]|uniref:Uncharacterized protein n=1 Tax=Gulosibacter macacae TaxID=2488791 RepID=A0A3P3W297_9MICO|nr:hypothetical protein [Gulosibacter macacae]RRJ86943.1 hypothetical protein EG850_05905 [Gulosibacter macacae]
MYGALWRVLPGPWPVKLLLLLILIAAVLAALVIWVFPWVDSFLPGLLLEGDVTIGAGITG